MSPLDTWLLVLGPPAAAEACRPAMPQQRRGGGGAIELLGRSGLIATLQRKECLLLILLPSRASHQSIPPLQLSCLAGEQRGQCDTMPSKSPAKLQQAAGVQASAACPGSAWHAKSSAVKQQSLSADACLLAWPCFGKEVEPSRLHGQQVLGRGGLCGI